MRLIDADALVEDIGKKIDEEIRAPLGENHKFFFCAGMRYVVRLVKRLPTVDPVKHGHWIFTGRTYKCSNCCLKEDNAVEADLCDMPLINFKYCPNCGTKMDEKPGGDKVDEKKEQKE